jgi:quercetin dioxygenase-like cupin family protein
MATPVFKVDFDAMDWQDGRPGVRFKLYREGSRQLRLIEFATSEADPHWCDRNHIGFVVAGGLTIDFNGTLLSFAAGDGLFIPPGAANAHRAVTITPGTRLVMVEDV